MRLAKPRFRFDSHSNDWRSTVGGRQSIERHVPCVLCGRPAFDSGGWGPVCRNCGLIRREERAEAHRIFQGARRRGEIRYLPDGLTKCADCERAASCWEHRDYRFPLQVDPCCQWCNRRRGRAMTAHEYSFLAPRSHADGARNLS